MTITTNNSTLKLFIDETDYTDYLVPETLDYVNEIKPDASAKVMFSLKQMPDTFQMQGGHRVDVYLPNQSTALFSGQATKVRPIKHSVSGWTYRLEATSWEYSLYRKKSYVQVRNLTYANAVNAVLEDVDQSYPTVLSKAVVDSTGYLGESMPFHSFNGVYPGDILTRVALLTSTAWRIRQSGTSAFYVEFYNPYVYDTASALEFNNTTNNFHWLDFEPELNTENLINSQTVRGSIVPSTTPSVEYFRGDNLSSNFPLPLKPYSNIDRVEVFDHFDGNSINSRTWLESDTSDDYVYQDGDGFLQFEIDGTPQWVGIESTANVERSNKPIAVHDITWIGHGRCVLGLSNSTFSTADPVGFLEAGIRINSIGEVQSVVTGTTYSTGVVLTEGQQYRFRTCIKEAGCRIEYQAGSDIYTRNWTLLKESDTGTANDLKATIYSYDANLNVDMVKVTNPYLGIKVEVDRGKGFQEEFVGIYPIDEDVDVVLEGEQTISFFGSDPGPSTIPPAPTSKEFEVSDAAQDLMTVVNGHGVASGSPVTVSTDGTLPSPLSDAATYYLYHNNFTSFKLFTDQTDAENGSGSSLVNITDSGSGTHTLTITEWVGKDADYKNIKVTYNPGQRLTATFRDSASVANIVSLFGLGDSGVREGNIIVDETLTSYQACLDRARLEVDNNKNIIRQLKLRTSLNTLEREGNTLPMVGTNARFNITVDATNEAITEDLPIVEMRLKAKRGANNFDVQFTAGFLRKGLKEVIASLSDGLFISVSDSEVFYKSSLSSDSLTFSDTTSSYSNQGVGWFGDSRFSETFTADAGTDIITLASDEGFVTGMTVAGETAGTLPEGMEELTAYFYHRLSGTTGYLYDTYDNAVAGGATGRLNITSTGSGTHTLKAAGFRWNHHNWGSFYTDTARVALRTANVLSSQYTIT